MNKETYHKISHLFKSNDEANHALAYQLLTSMELPRLDFTKLRHKLILSLNQFYKLVDYGWIEFLKDDIRYLGFREDRSSNCPHIPLEVIPEEVWEFKNLTTLQFCYYGIKELSPKVGALKDLRLLSLTNNKLECLPKEIGNLSQLKTLYLSNNFLSFENSFPNTIANLKLLKELNIIYNGMKTIPLVFQHLINLRKLVLGSNKLIDFPQELHSLEKLRVLHLDGNYFETVPEHLVKFKNLKQIHLKFNKIKGAIPAAFKKHNSIKRIIVRPNRR